ncbi:hypothetical protein CCHL11_03054 [Colletotrichum chlorophyti]|uniref:Cyanovirin-N domain-containing protein n=1 Tax=Colletotrichum chlorophyti TaxID=708187 RepID=A0A1Q8RGF6_9PEZI|nr:hypothetical protein CCHL11_03054 [Colletotrichum chlorophyti]
MHLSAFSSILLAAIVVRVAGHFSKLAGVSHSYSSTSLSATCNNIFRESQNTQIDLTRCLANVGGRLVFCGYSLSGDKIVLNCRCTDSTGTKRPTSINLSQRAYLLLTGRGT